MAGKTYLAVALWEEHTLLCSRTVTTTDRAELEKHFMTEFGIDDPPEQMLAVDGYELVEHYGY